MIRYLRKEEISNVTKMKGDCKVLYMEFPAGSVYTEYIKKQTMRVGSFRYEVNDCEKADKVYYKADFSDCCPGDNFCGVAGISDE